ncbi:MAG: hypothetical protein PHC28_09400 [Flavobacterium sp.]|uniref:hypothetical protein n=1 Tax=Flavobacterium sp. TaxID=239 RepID=UPI00260D8C16|nr:hypothetical protein [Flavobacterium sp.]MDD5150685.1 hypothetical protein [Flavobacterium sp.]
MKSIMLLDCFDYCLISPLPDRKMKVAEKDLEILKNADRVSIFWITENQRRAKMITKLQKDAIIELDNTIGYPWLKVKYNTFV